MALMKEVMPFMLPSVLLTAWKLDLSLRSQFGSKGRALCQKQGRKQNEPAHSLLQGLLLGFLYEREMTF